MRLRLESTTRNWREGKAAHAGFAAGQLFSARGPEKALNGRPIESIPSFRARILQKSRAVFERGLKNHGREGGPRPFPELKAAVSARLAARASEIDAPLRWPRPAFAGPARRDSLSLARRCSSCLSGPHCPLQAKAALEHASTRNQRSAATDGGQKLFFRLAIPKSAGLALQR